jgi:hypothetical protein
VVKAWFLLPGCALRYARSCFKNCMRRMSGKLLPDRFSPLFLYFHFPFLLPSPALLDLLLPLQSSSFLSSYIIIILFPLFLTPFSPLPHPFLPSAQPKLTPFHVHYLLPALIPPHSPPNDLPVHDPSFHLHLPPFFFYSPISHFLLPTDKLGLFCPCVRHILPLSPTLLSKLSSSPPLVPDSTRCLFTHVILTPYISVFLNTQNNIATFCLVFCRKRGTVHLIQEQEIP